MVIDPSGSSLKKLSQGLRIVRSIFPNLLSVRGIAQPVSAYNLSAGFKPSLSVVLQKCCYITIWTLLILSLYENPRSLVLEVSTCKVYRCDVALNLLIPSRQNGTEAIHPTIYAFDNPSPCALPTLAEQFFLLTSVSGVWDVDEKDMNSGTKICGIIPLIQ